MDITDEMVLEMFHRLTEEEQLSIFSRMILVEKSRLCVERLLSRE